MKPVALFLFDYSGLMAQDWANHGYDCYCFDGKHQEETITYVGEGSITYVPFWFEGSKAMEQFKQIADMVGPNVRFIASFAECTYLTTTGAKWFYHPDDKHLPTGQRRPHPLYPNRKDDRKEAIRLAKYAMKLSIFLRAYFQEDEPLPEIPWMLENPAVSFLNTMWRRPDHKFDPCDFGGYLPDGDVHPRFPGIYPGRDAYRKKTGLWVGGGFKMPVAMPVEAPKGFPGFLKAGGKSARTKEIRSITPRGLARGVYLFNR